MRHRKKGRKFTRSKNQEKALLNSLASALIIKEKIITTEAKAKGVRPFIEKLITRAKKDNLANRRFLAKNFSKEVIKKLFKELGLRYKNRPGGYIRITKINSRKEDAAKMAVLELIKEIKI